MTTIPLSADALTALAQPKTLVAVTDQTGQVVGFFAPVPLDNAAAYAEAAANATLFRKVLAEDPPRPSVTTAELLEQLKAAG